MLVSRVPEASADHGVYFWPFEEPKRGQVARLPLFVGSVLVIGAAGNIYFCIYCAQIQTQCRDPFWSRELPQSPPRLDEPLLRHPTTRTFRTEADSRGRARTSPTHERLETPHENDAD